MRLDLSAPLRSDREETLKEKKKMRLRDSPSVSALINGIGSILDIWGTQTPRVPRDWPPLVDLDIEHDQDAGDAPTSNSKPS